MARSIMQQGDPRCFFCGKRTELERHHVMSGTANRKLAEKFGIWVYCCDFHHRDPKDGVQYNREKADKLKALAQIAFESRYSHEKWMETFRKNYL